jgi:FdhD protein
MEISKYIYSHGCYEVKTGRVVIETPISLSVNGESLLTLMATPDNLEALVLGFLYNEKMIEALDDVALLRICPQGDHIDIWLNHSVEINRSWRRTSGCSGGITSVDEPNAIPAITLDPVILNAHTVLDLMLKFYQAQKMYDATGGVHASALSDGTDILLIAEDIGRHNTLDKLAGLYMLNKLSLLHKVIITTGRLTSEMLQKSIRIGSSFIISRTSPSSSSVKMAQDAGITLIGYARRDQFTVYTHPEHVIPS